jgi:putative hydrolase of the HAD superfamily
MIRAVFFDVGNTLIYAYPSVGEIYSGIGKKYGMHMDGDAVNVSFRKAFANRQTSSLNDVNMEREWWKTLVWETVVELCTPKDFNHFFEELFDFFVQAEAWQVFPDVLPALRALRDRDIKLGIISNWDSRLLPILDNLNLSDYFTVLAVSALVGSAKPDAGIFEYAVSRLEVRPEEAIHVGDNVEMDCNGAKACGMTPLLLDRKNRSASLSSCFTIHSLTDLLAYI